MTIAFALSLSHGPLKLRFERYNSRWRYLLKKSQLESLVVKFAINLFPELAEKVFVQWLSQILYLSSWLLPTQFFSLVSGVFSNDSDNE